MASTNTITQTSDSVSGEARIMSNVILQTDVFQKFATVPAVRDKFRMWNGEVSDDMIQNYSDSPTETGTATVSDEEFTIVKKSIFHGVPYDIFKDTIFNVSINNLKDQGLPPIFVDMVADLVGKKAAKFAAQDIYNGNGGQTGDPTGFDGIRSLVKTKLTAASLTNRVIADGTNDPSTVGGIKEALDSMKAQFSEDMIEEKDEFVILMNGVVNDAWYEYLSGVAATNIPQSSSLKYQNYNIEIAKGLSSRCILMCKKENINVSLAVTGELLSLDIVDQYVLGQGNKARAVGNYGYGVGIATEDFVIFEYTA